jgi:hypothetical protein
MAICEMATSANRAAKEANAEVVKLKDKIEMMKHNFTNLKAVVAAIKKLK